MTAWPPKDWRALLALVFSILGAVVLTVFLWWLCAQLLPGGEDGWSDRTEISRASTLRWVAWIASASIGLVLLGLGFAINRRSLSARWGDKGLDWAGGDTDPSPEQAARKVKNDVERAAEESVEQIEQRRPDTPEGEG